MLSWINEQKCFVDLRIHPNLRSTVYCSSIAAGGAAEWDFGWNKFKNASIAIEADKLRAALACTQKPWLLNRWALRQLHKAPGTCYTCHIVYEVGLKM